MAMLELVVPVVMLWWSLLSVCGGQGDLFGRLGNVLDNMARFSPLLE